MKRISPVQKYAAQFRYEHKNRGSHFGVVKKHSAELSKLLDEMFPGERKKKRRNRNKYLWTNQF